MKRRHFIHLLGAASSMIALRGLAQSLPGEPIPLPVANLRISEEKYYSIYQSGKYVFVEDKIQQKLWGAGHTGPKGGALLYVHCGYVNIDLHGHTLGADFGVSGVWLNAKHNEDTAKTFAKFSYPESGDNRMVRLHNGTIDLARGEDTGDGVVFNNEWQANTSRGYLGDSSLVARPFIWQGQTKIPLIDIPYERNDYTLEKLKVLAHDVAVLLEGSHSVIRDCIIESAGGAAVIIAGPNAVIENCEIRLRSSKKYYNREGQPRAAIVLRDGSNAVIRNNRIRIDYGGEVENETHCILIRDGASNVLVEGNTFINVKGNPVTLLDGAQATVQNNKSTTKIWPF